MIPKSGCRFSVKIMLKRKSRQASLAQTALYEIPNLAGGLQIAARVTAQANCAIICRGTLFVGCGPN
jgi:hypothetical protein